MFREISFSVLVGFLTAFLLYVNVGQTAELGCLRLRYLLSQLVSADRAKPEVTVIDIDSSQSGLADDQTDSSIADSIDLIAGSNPAAIVLYMDLRQVRPNGKLMDAIRNHREKIIVGYFGIGELTPNIYGKLVTTGIKCGYTDLPISSYGVVCNLPVKSQIAQGGLLTSAVTPLAMAVSDVAFPKEKTEWIRISEKYPLGTEFWVDFLNKPKVKTIPLLQLNSKNTKWYSDAIDQKIVVFAAPEKASVQTPLPEEMTPLSVHLQAIGTFINGVHLVDFNVIGAWLVMPLGALVGLLYHRFNPLQRVNAMLISLLFIIIFGQISFQLLHIVIPTMAPLMVILSCYLACSVILLEVEHIDKARDIAMSLETRTEEERKRISQEIHDDTLPSLARVRRIAHSMKTATPEDDTPNQICEWLDLTITDMRRLVDDLHPLALENLGLNPALESLVSRFAKHAKIDASFEASTEEGDSMPPSAKLSIYRIVQESLNNVEKHANASQVKVLLFTSDGWLTISVADNGKGFSIESVNGDSHGLANIRERAKLIHATVNWTRPESFSTGTELVIRVKL